MKESECKSTKDNVSEHYEKQWDSLSEEDVLLRVKNLAPVIDSIISPIDIKDKIRILDVGCGPAIIPLWIDQKLNMGIDIIGVDISKTAILLGREMIRKSHYNNIRLLLGDFETLPFSHGTFDAVISNATFNLLPEKQRGILEIARILRNHGTVVIGDCVAKEKRCQGEQDNKLWSQCVAGAPTKKELLVYAQKGGLVFLESFNLTQKVKDLVKSGLWSWPEFLEHDLEYHVFSFKKEP
jgi:ubiquinone/menaquinone biosynthesis C-methylase UbiE